MDEVKRSYGDCHKTCPYHKGLSDLDFNFCNKYEQYIHSKFSFEYPSKRCHKCQRDNRSK